MGGVIILVMQEPHREGKFLSVTLKLQQFSFSSRHPCVLSGGCASCRETKRSLSRPLFPNRTNMCRGEREGSIITTTTVGSMVYHTTREHVRASSTGTPIRRSRPCTPSCKQRHEVCFVVTRGHHGQFLPRIIMISLITWSNRV